MLRPGTALAWTLSLCGLLAAGFPTVALSDPACLDWKDFGIEAATGFDWCTRFVDYETNVIHLDEIEYTLDSADPPGPPPGPLSTVSLQEVVCHYHYVYLHLPYPPGADVTGAHANVVSVCQRYLKAVPAPEHECDHCKKNRLVDPLDPASGNMNMFETDNHGNGPNPAFSRYYNSFDTSQRDLGPGWRHSYSRSITPRYDIPPFIPYIGDSSNSPLYTTESDACLSGFPQIQSQITNWSSATASYAGDHRCTISRGGSTIGILPIVYAQWPLPPATPVLEGFDVTRDDGQVIGFDGTGTSITAPASISLRLQQTSSGFVLTDDEDNVEQYDTNGKLLSVTSRSGVTETVGYDASSRDNSVTDAFGHRLSLSYDGTGRLTTVTDEGSHTIQYGFDAGGRLSVVINPDSSTRSYVYEDATHPNAITGSIDESATPIFDLGIRRSRARDEYCGGGRCQQHILDLQP
jgi:YD repeat-containing protein